MSPRTPAQTVFPAAHGACREDRNLATGAIAVARMGPQILRGPGCMFVLLERDGCKYNADTGPRLALPHASLSRDGCGGTGAGGDAVHSLLQSRPRGDVHAPSRYGQDRWRHVADGAAVLLSGWLYRFTRAEQRRADNVRLPAGSALFNYHSP